MVWISREWNPGKAWSDERLAEEVQIEIDRGQQFFEDFCWRCLHEPTNCECEKPFHWPQALKDFDLCSRCGLWIERGDVHSTLAPQHSEEFCIIRMSQQMRRMRMDLADTIQQVKNLLNKPAPLLPMTFGALPNPPPARLCPTISERAFGCGRPIGHEGLHAFVAGSVEFCGEPFDRASSSLACHLRKGHGGTHYYFYPLDPATNAPREPERGRSQCFPGPSFAELEIPADAGPGIAFVSVEFRRKP